jgi:DNA-binding Lrp family transcriptional regulator
MSAPLDLDQLQSFCAIADCGSFTEAARRVNKTQSAVSMQIKRLEDDIRKLKIDFDIYFNGSTKRPPLEAPARLESQIKRMLDNRSMTFGQRYQMNMLVSRFTSYRELWRRTLKKRGEELI